MVNFSVVASGFSQSELAVFICFFFMVYIYFRCYILPFLFFQNKLNYIFLWPISCPIRRSSSKGIGLEWGKKPKQMHFCCCQGKKKEKNTQSPPEWGIPYLNSFYNK